MASLRELIIKISANSQSFQSEISRASRMGSDYYRTMQNGGRQAALAARESQRAIAELNNQLVSAKSTVAGFSGAIAGALTVTSIITAADNWGQVTSRLKMATESTEEYAMVQKRLMEISDRTYKPIEEQAELYIRSSTAMKELGYSTSATVDFIDSISSALTINAASADKGTSAINALSKSMVQGKVSGGEWQTVMEVMPTVIGDVARHLGTTENAVKKLASEGKLSMQTFSDAVIAAQKRNAELADSMPNTVGDALTKLSNHWKTYISDANSASGATAAVSATISDLATNIDTVAKIGGVLVGVGAARYFGGMIGGAYSATADLINAAKKEVALSQAQLRGTQISTARARADVYRAQQAVIAARGTDALVAAEKRLERAQAMLTRNIAARTAAQTALNNVTATGSRLMSGALGLVGGIPGLLMLGAGAWYYMYQQQEQARQSARDYASQIDEIKNKTASMSLPDLDKNRGNTIAALQEQKRLIEEQEKSVNKLKEQIDKLNSARGAPGINSSNDIEILKAIEIVMGNLAIEESKLNQLREKSLDIQEALSKVEWERDNKIRSVRAEENKAYQSLIRMNGVYDLINKTLSTGNILLANRQVLVNAPMRISQAEATEKQTEALEKSRRDLALSKLKDEAKERQRLAYAADDLGLSTAPEHQTMRQEFINNGLAEWGNNQANKPQKKTGKTEAEKTENVYDRLIKQQQEQIALAGSSTELAKVKYQISKGELATLTDAQKADLARNASALDMIKTQEKFKALQDELLTPEEELLKKTKERIKLLKEAAPATEKYREVMERISKDSVTKAPEFGGLDASVGGASGELIRVAEAQAELEKWHKTQLDMQKKLLEEKEGYEQEYANRIAEITQQMHDRQSSIQSSYTAAALGMFSSMTSDAASMLQAMGQEGSAAYKAMFLASKAASIAMAIVNTEEAATKALTMGTIFGIPASTMIRGIGYTSVALMASTTLAGMAHDGIDSVPREGTWLLDRGERVVDARTNADLKNYLSNRTAISPAAEQRISESTQKTSTTHITQNITVSGNGDAALNQGMKDAARQGALEGAKLARQEMLQDFATNGNGRRLLGI